MEISRIYLLFVQSLAIYVIMFNLESLYCILLNKIKSNEIKLAFRYTMCRSLKGKGYQSIAKFLHPNKFIVYRSCLIINAPRYYQSYRQKKRREKFVKKLISLLIYLILWTHTS